MYKAGLLLRSCCGRCERKRKAEGVYIHGPLVSDGSLVRGSLGSRPSRFVHIRTQFISACGTHQNGEGLALAPRAPGMKYHVRIVGGAIGKALLLFPEAGSSSYLVEELLASRIICTMCGILSIWLLIGSGDLCVKPRPFAVP